MPRESFQKHKFLRFNNKFQGGTLKSLCLTRPLGDCCAATCFRFAHYCAEFTSSALLSQDSGALGDKHPSCLLCRRPLPLPGLCSVDPALVAVIVTSGLQLLHRRLTSWFSGSLWLFTEWPHLAGAWQLPYISILSSDTFASTP